MDGDIRLAWIGVEGALPSLLKFGLSLARFDKADGTREPGLSQRDIVFKT